MDIKKLIYNLSNVSDLSEENLRNIVVGQVSVYKIKTFINLMSPNNTYEMEEMFSIVLNMIEVSKGNLDEEMAKDILLCLLKKIEMLEKVLCPEFSDKTFNFDSLSIKDSLITIAQSYIKFVESVYMSFNNYLKEMSRSFYKIKTDIIRRSLNSMEDVCLI